MKDFPFFKLKYFVKKIKNEQYYKILLIINKKNTSVDTTFNTKSAVQYSSIDVC